MKTKEKKLRKNQKGFTLIEMIVVIAIIGVLAAIITPSIMGQVNKSKISKNANNAKTIAMAAQAINAESDNPLRASAAAGATIALNNVAWGTPTGIVAGSGANMQAALKEMVGTTGYATITFDQQGAVTHVQYSVSDATYEFQIPATTESKASVTDAIWVK